MASILQGHSHTYLPDIKPLTVTVTDNFSQVRMGGGITWRSRRKTNADTGRACELHTGRCGSDLGVEPRTPYCEVTVQPQYNIVLQLQICSYPGDMISYSVKDKSVRGITEEVQKIVEVRFFKTKTNMVYIFWNNGKRAQM